MVLSSVDAADDFCDSVVAFIDTLPVCQTILPRQPSYKLGTLVTNVLNTTYNAHDALEDVRVLDRVFDVLNVQEELKRFSFAPKEVVNSINFLDAKASNFTSLHPLIAAGVCKTLTAENIAGSGLHMRHLRKIYERKGHEGLRATFTAKNNVGKARVCDNKKLLDGIIHKMACYFEQHK